MPCTYILRSKITGNFYIGSSRDKEATKRLRSHNSGKTKSTKSARPWIVVNEEQYNSYTEARHRENFLKSGVGRKWIREKFGGVA